MNAGLGARRFDLHLHSTRSDGAVTPEELVEHCLSGGLDVISLTDHDLSSVLRPGLHAGGGRTVRVLAGAELSGVHDGREYHLLVYFPGEIPDRFRTFCTGRARERAERYATAVESIGLPDLPSPSEEARAGEQALTRHHLARALVAAGHAGSLREAFRRFADDAHGHVPRITLPFVDAIRIAREAGAVTSWAHPPLPALERYLPTFVEAGLQALEALRPMTSSRDRRRIRRMADQHGLFLTGGSDWHGWHDPRPGLFHVQRDQLSGFLDALGVDL